MSVRGAAALAVAAAAHVAAADPAPPYAVGVELGARLTILAGDDVLERAVISGARTWDDRWEVGVRATYDVGTGENGDIRIPAIEGEVGMWLHPSPQIDVLLGWRAGYASLRLGAVDVRAAVVETAMEMAYHWRPRLELRIAPALVTGYRSGLWQITIGPELGVAWRL